MIDYNIDLTTECDTAPKPDDGISELTSRVSGSILINCAGGNFSSLEGKTVGTLGGTTIETSCAGARAVKFAATHTVAARKQWVPKTATARPGTTPPTTDPAPVLPPVLAIRETTTATGGLDGLPCVLRREEKMWLLDGCRKQQSERSYEGPPEFANVSPNAEINEQTKARPRVNLTDVILQSVALRSEDRFYHGSSATTFTLNNWKASLAYTNGWAAPSFKAVSVAGETVDSTLGAP